MMKLFATLSKRWPSIEPGSVSFVSGGGVGNVTVTANAASDQCLFLVRSGFELDAPFISRLVEQIRIMLAENPHLFNFLEEG